MQPKLHLLYDSTAKLAYLLHPTELIFIIAKGIHKLYMHMQVHPFTSFTLIFSLIIHFFTLYLFCCCCCLSTLPPPLLHMHMLCTHKPCTHIHGCNYAHTHKLANLRPMHSTQLYHALSHTTLLMHSPFVCSIHTMYAALIFCYIYTWGY